MYAILNVVLIVVQIVVKIVVFIQWQTVVQNAVLIIVKNVVC